MNQLPELLITAGPLAGQRFAVTASGLRMGRSSSCEISIKDPALSRNHCLVEVRDDALWITDLASANGTLVNGTELGADSVQLKVGDVIEAGDSALKVELPVAAAAPAVDLGLGQADEEEAEEFDEQEKPNPMRFVLWGVAGVAVLGAAWLILGGDAPAIETPQPASTAVKPVVVEEVESPDNSGTLVAVAFEKVKASSKGVYRLAIDYTADGTLRASVDDVPVANRHVSKTVALADDKRERLARIFQGDALYRLDAVKTGPAANAGELASTRLRVVRSTCVFNVYVENAQEPEALLEVREQFEAFAKNELGIWGVDKSVDELKDMSATARRTGDAKWEERDVQHGNLAQAILSYEEAVSLLQTVNPKPEGFDALTARLREAKAELDKRYKEQCFRADKAINLKDWAAALTELRILRDLVPSDRDPRHAEANAKLLDVEARQKGGK